MKQKISWFLQILIAILLAQTLFFKFTAHPDSVALFTELGMEPKGRILIGILEAVTVVLLLVPRTVLWGAFLSLALMTGAIISHITKLGWEDGRGELGAMAILIWFCSLAIAALRCPKLGGKQQSAKSDSGVDAGAQTSS